MGCGTHPKQVSSVLVQVIPSGSSSSTPVVQFKPEEDSEPEEDDAAATLRVGRQLSEMMLEVAPADHSYIKQTPSVMQPVWIKRIEREWRILTRGLPEVIHLHLYEDRMDLMRACIIGPRNTPYADALLFFDLHLPQDYPRVPPQFTFWAYGKRLNPNLYASGRICLSILGTWSGTGVENWQPQTSNVLQVLVSILGLVLVEEPYYNEPGFELSRGKPESDAHSRKYTEDVRLMVLRSMLLAPPKDFEEVYRRHFEVHGASIVKRTERLATSKVPSSALGRIDGISVNKDSPSESCKKELLTILSKLKEAWPNGDESADCDVAEILPIPMMKEKSIRLGWMGRLGLAGGC